MQWLGIEAGLLPLAAIMDKQEAVMQAIGAVQPEFDALRMQTIAAPVGRTGDSVWMGLGEGVGLGFERFAAGEGTALVGNGCAYLTATRTAVEVNVGSVFGKLGDRAFDADLTAKRLPVKAECRARVFGELAALLAFVVGEEAEALFSNTLGQNHTHARCAACGCGSEGRGIGVVGLAGFSFAKPEVELEERIF